MPWVFDGPNKRIYEAPPGTDYELVGGLRRYYSTGSAPAVTDWDLLADIWTPYVDWFHAGGHRYELAFARSGGNLRPSGVNSPTDIQAINGWRLILADYPHDATINGNLFQEGPDKPLWDLSLHTVSNIGRTVNTSANLLAYAAGGAATGINDVLTLTRWIRDRLEADEVRTQSRITVKRRGTGEVLVDKDVSGSCDDGMMITDHVSG